MSDLSEDSDVEELASGAAQSLLPEKSKVKYETAYKQFGIWCTEKRVKAINEAVLMAYFELKSKTLKYSTLWTLYSMLRATIQLKKNIDIKKFISLIALLKRKSAGEILKKSGVLTKPEITKFLKEADDTTYLFMKVALIVGISGACRTEELTSLLLENVRDHGSHILINIPHTKTNVRREFTINQGNFESFGNLLAIFKKYSALRPPAVPHGRFFVTYRNGKCTKQPVGIHTIGSVPQKIANYLQLSNSNSYTGHCFRRTSAVLLADAGAAITTVKRYGGWKSTNVAEGYIENSVENKLQVSSKILGARVAVAAQVFTASEATEPQSTLQGIHFYNLNEVKEDVAPRNLNAIQHEQGSTSKTSRSCKRKISEEEDLLIDDNESPISDLISEYATDDHEERRKEVELEHVKELHKLRIHHEKELHAIKMQTEKVKLKLQEEKLRHFKELCLLRCETKSSDEES